MSYDFTTRINRQPQNSSKWQGMRKHNPEVPEGIVPLSVADMELKNPPEIIEGLKQFLDNRILGYTDAGEDYYTETVNWMQRRHHWTIDKDWLVLLPGVVTAINVAVRAFVQPREKVAILTPVYYPFKKTIEACGCRTVTSSLINQDGVYSINFEDLETKLADPNVKMLIFCSPHNPTGRVWEQWEIEKAMKIYKKHDVYVVSDEIWSDLLLNGHKHTPTQSVSEDAKQRTVALYAPSKTFNLAGLIGSYHIIYNDWLRERILKESSLSHYNSMNLLSMYALIGAYKPEGYEWVDELKEVLSGNVNYACDYIEKHFDGVNVSRPEGTYMLFLDCTEWCKKHGRTITELQAAGIEVGVIWQDGVAFHGPCHIRMNLALPLSRVKEAFDRLDKYVFNVLSAPRGHFNPQEG